VNDRRRLPCREPGCSAPRHCRRSTRCRAHTPARKPDAARVRRKLVRIVRDAREHAAVLEFLRSFIAGFGYSPSLVEIGAHFRWRNAIGRVRRMVRAGLITMDRGRARSIRIVEEQLALGAPERAAA
jgi:hypothetical protein